MNRGDLQKSLPSSISHDKNILDISSVIDEQLVAIDKNANELLLLPRLDLLPEAIVDELAWQYHVDFYDSSYPIEKKRELVGQAIRWHRIKGTPAAVDEVISAVFSSGRAFEWWEYDGEPYHFQVRMIEEPCPNIKVIKGLQKAIDDCKNVRSWCDGIQFYRKIEGKSCFLGYFTAMRKTSIYPSRFTMPELNADFYFNKGMALYRKVLIK